MEKFATSGDGPPFRRCGRRALYRKAAVLEWMEKAGRVVTSTAEYKGKPVAQKSVALRNKPAEETYWHVQVPCRTWKAAIACLQSLHDKVCHENAAQPVRIEIIESDDKRRYAVVWEFKEKPPRKKEAFVAKPASEPQPALHEENEVQFDG